MDQAVSPIEGERRFSLCFFDPIGWDYNVDTPAHRPFGGSQSALCYLAVELAKLGHAVTVLTDTSRPGIVSGVMCLNKKEATRRFFMDSKFDAVIVLNGPAEWSTILSPNLPSSTMLILWTQHAVDQRAMAALSRRDAREKWDHIVCVSEWHRRTVIETFGIDETKTSVLRNAIAPTFESLFSSRDELVESKADGLRLVYTSTPFRGLDVLLEVFPSFKAKNPTATLEVYSSMAVYQQAAEADPYRQLYDAAKAMNGVEYVGSLPQPTLAERLQRAHIFSYPNTFAETSCISVMEALAAGLHVVTSDLGALSETALGFARLVPFHENRRAHYVSSYRDALAEPYSLAEHADRLYEQVVAINAKCTWRARASEWSEFLTRVLAEARVQEPEANSDPTICLNMIVKNEARVIERCLASLRSAIDTWVIVDTGSTDGTPELIRKCLAGIPGELHERPWVNFGHNRTEAIGLAEGKADYLLLCDADMTLKVLDPGWKRALVANSYLVRQDAGAFSYFNARLINARLGGDRRWRYWGSTHEYLGSVRPSAVVAHETTHGISFDDLADGGSRSGKFERDARLLLSDLDAIDKLERRAAANPSDVALASELSGLRHLQQRSMFYLAQTWRDAGELRKSLKTYERRATMGGWDEEVWYSLYEVARLSERVELPAAKVTERYLAAYQFRPRRAEPLVELARFHRERKEYALAHLFALRAINILKPDDILFLDVAAYQWRAIDEFAVASYWIGDYARALRANEKLLEDALLPVEHLARVTENLNFCREALRKTGGPAGSAAAVKAPGAVSLRP